MRKPTQAEITEYARECRRDHPQITEAELKDILRARFIDRKDPLATTTKYGGIDAKIRCGAANPIDWFLDFFIVAGLRKLFRGDISGVRDMINEASRIVMEES